MTKLLNWLVEYQPGTHQLDWQVLASIVFALFVCWIWSAVRLTKTMRAYPLEQRRNAAGRIVRRADMEEGL
jgi:hypothetical protein